MGTMNRILNAVGFQSAWWVLVVSAGLGLDRAALVYAVALACAHVYWSQNRRRECKIAALVMFIGTVLDSTLQASGVIRFNGWAVGPLSPMWLWMLWLLFGMTLNSSLAFLKTRPLVLSAALGALLGPMNYIAGAQLGAASLVVTHAHIAQLGLCWLIALPVMVWLAQKMASGHTLNEP